MPPSPKYTVLLPSRWGWFCGLKADPFQTGSVATIGEWAPVEAMLLRAFLRPGDTVVDVGANVGNLTLAMAAAVGDAGRVLAFEPQRFPFGCLWANVALNSLMHVVSPLQLAVGDSAGAVEVPQLDPMQHITNFGGVSLLDKHTTPTEIVARVTLDEMQLPALRLLKCDVEGMEPAVFRGARDTIMRLRPVIWTECLRDRNTFHDLEQLFDEFGYRAWFCYTNLFCPENARGCRHNMFVGPNGEMMQDHNVLALPMEAPVPDWVAEGGATEFAEEKRGKGEKENTGAPFGVPASAGSMESK
jgi:FkbM family methyltransferase